MLPTGNYPEITVKIVKSFRNTLYVHEDYTIQLPVDYSVFFFLINLIIEFDNFIKTST